MAAIRAPALFFLVFALSPPSVASASPSSSTKQAAALLSFKNTFMLIDPSNCLHNWDQNLSDVCSWYGVQCLYHNIVALDLTNCSIKGTLRLDDLMPLEHLHHVCFSHNQLYGRLSSTLSSSPCRFQSLDLSYNLLSEVNSSFLQVCKNLTYLDFSYNTIITNISELMPDKLDTDINLEHLYISSNMMVGQIPNGFSHLKKLLTLDLSSNLISGRIPQSLCSAAGKLERLILRSNKLVGSIPKEIGRCKHLQYLDLSSNNLNGVVPSSVNSLPNISVLELSGNSGLCGKPLSPCNSTLNNEVRIVIPASKSSRKNTNPTLFKKQKVRITLAITAGLCLVLAALAALYSKRRNKRTPTAIIPIIDQYPLVSYGDLCKATSGFSSFNLIGSGSYAHVYLGILDCFQTIVAIKVIKVQQEGASKSYIAECKSLRSIRHRNLVKVLTACSSIDYQGNEFRALVFEYMPNGSLEKWLHNGLNWRLGFLQRLNIAIDIACALDYLHQHCVPRIIHCDLKPSNILLDCDMTACVGDFGLARFIIQNSSSISENQSISLRIKGTIGYIAPEYSMGAKASIHGDIYSYGIILLEMFTGRRPTSEMFNEALSLHNYVKMALREDSMDIVDPFLLSATQLPPNYSNKVHDCIKSVMEIGVKCSVDSPRARMQIKDVVARLKLINKALIINGFS